MSGVSGVMTWKSSMVPIHGGLYHGHYLERVEWVLAVGRLNRYTCMRCYEVYTTSSYVPYCRYGEPKWEEELLAMIPIEFKEVLDYYDGPLIFMGVDKDENGYLGSMVDRTPTHDIYVVTEVTPLQLAQFCTGELELHEPFLEGDWFLTVEEGEQTFLQLQLEPIAETEYLPKAGYRLRKPDADQELAAV